MAKLVGLSRQRFHQLMKEGVFPPPVYDIATRRPHYTEEMQQVCMTVGRRTSASTGGSFCSMPVVLGSLQENKQ